MRKSIAEQLLEIAKIETDIPIGKAQALIAGTGETAEELKALLPEIGVRTVLFDEAAEEREFSLVFLLGKTDNEKLLSLIVQNALVIDCAAKSNGEWNIFDGKNSFRRVRVVSLIETSV